MTKKDEEKEDDEDDHKGLGKRGQMFVFPGSMMREKAGSMSKEGQWEAIEESWGDRRWKTPLRKTGREGFGEERQS